MDALRGLDIYSAVEISCVPELVPGLRCAVVEKSCVTSQCGSEHTRQYLPLGARRSHKLPSWILSSPQHGEADNHGGMSSHRHSGRA